MTVSTAGFVLGTRPEIIKLAPVIQECHRRGLDTHVIHTGQHYSDSLDTVFFRQLGLSPPDTNLEVGSDDHGAQTGAMLAGIEEELHDAEPAVVFVQGDTNSTLAGALAGSKMDVDVAHVEAGLRSFDDDMPEETNRVIIDHISDHLFPPTEETAALLRDEGISEDRITVTGNTVVDAVETYDDKAASESRILSELGVAEGQFDLLTAHRAETVDDQNAFERILSGVSQASAQADREVIYPIHPRAEDRLEEFGIAVPDQIRPIEPLGFFDFLRLESTADVVFTDSGGVQEETSILGTPCVTLRYGTERPETAFAGANCVAGRDPVDIITAAMKMRGKSDDWTTPFGDGRAAVHILDAIPALAVEEPIKPTE
ncbi:UDP-N-acetylglucosamine 2-epimerase (non-hydrolyzing) [Haloarcula sp. CBA1130]|uniref:non-hydrolyzing UDP-N-acetylglucosamine 2-epimerase n=1 Tax=unclassified Haloarcula TaxID=2624677 RepID=UPI0012447160|nr:MULTISPECIES: UDP-N-acetylglucosamine 2-epimerase (non-hydrolyzing) [unclassified Haloarcula]KAA9395871.1 UDP-N-acetylglucosamine 2-epimerase (non-hydrolyzing) [Haloarcula sp. CBA1129]KAA9400199.1 UDP-N-acetylglucosamine 2-epimerase (non-hydrolyzing) [Haloarcula sp. CBA1130]